MNDKQLEALVRKNAAKAAKASQKRSAYTDPTLEATRGSAGGDDSDAKKIFKEMKKREF
jgi:hypothetical protein